MNIKSLAVSIVVVFVALTLTDLLIHGLWLSSLYGASAQLWRPEAEMGSAGYMAWLHGGQLLAAAAFTLLWAAGFAGTAKLGCSMKYGLTMGLFSQANTLITYAVTPLPAEIAVKWFFSGLLQALLLGIIVFYVYRAKATSA